MVVNDFVESKEVTEGVGNEKTVDLGGFLLQLSKISCFIAFLEGTRDCEAATLVGKLILRCLNVVISVWVPIVVV